MTLVFITHIAGSVSCIFVSCTFCVYTCVYLSAHVYANCVYVHAFVRVRAGVPNRKVGMTGFSATGERKLQRLRYTICFFMDHL